MIYIERPALMDLIFMIRIRVSLFATLFIQLSLVFCDNTMFKMNASENSRIFLWPLCPCPSLYFSVFFSDSRELTNSASRSQEGSHKRQSTIATTEGQTIFEFIIKNRDIEFQDC